MTDMEYRIVGRWGQWSEIHDHLQHVANDLEYCRGAYEDRDAFYVESREVGEWATYDGEIPAPEWTYKEPHLGPDDPAPEFPAWLEGEA